MTAGPLACDLVAVTAVVDTEATEGGVFMEGAMGLSVTGPTEAAWKAGPCVGVLSVWRFLGVVELAVGWLGVCSEGLRVPVGLLAFAVAAAAGGGVAPGRVLGVLRAAVADGAGCAVGAHGVGTPEAVRSGAPAVAAEVPTSVLGAVLAVTVVGPGLATEVSLASVAGEGATVLVSSDVSLKRLSVVSPDARFLTEFSCVSLRTKYPGFRDATRHSDKDKEEMQTSTRAAHILQVSREQGRTVPGAPSGPLSSC